MENQEATASAEPRRKSRKISASGMATIERDIRTRVNKKFRNEARREMQKKSRKANRR
jgi:hypothetical protein